MIVTLSMDEARWCMLLAVERYMLRRGAADVPHDERGKKEGWTGSVLLAGMRGNAAECAVAKALNRVWNMPLWSAESHKHRKHLADVGTNIEVRTVWTRAAIAVWPKDRGRIIVGCKVLDEKYLTEVEIYGWYDMRATLPPDEWKCGGFHPYA
jgi:hypothetical protein